MEVADTFSGRRLEVLNNFSSLADFIWKTPRLIDDERERERKKLHLYFPDEGDDERRSRNAELRKLRAYLEGKKLVFEFPEFMAHSNLFMAASAFERHLLGFAKDVEQISGRPLKEVKGQGVSKLFRYLGENGYDPSKIAFYEQVDAFLTIRNALLHASGDLELCREAPKIKQIVQHSIFIERSRRAKGGLPDECGRPEAVIIADRLLINNNLAFRAAAYFKQFLLELGRNVQPEDEAATAS